MRMGAGAGVFLTVPTVEGPPFAWGADELIKAHELDEFIGNVVSFSATTALDVEEYFIQ
jgi:hypothetical protein